MHTSNVHVISVHVISVHVSNVHVSNVHARKVRVDCAGARDACVSNVHCRNLHVINVGVGNYTFCCSLPENILSLMPTSNSLMPKYIHFIKLTFTSIDTQPFA